LVKSDPVTDGPRLYFSVQRSLGDSPDQRFLAQVASTGGETVTLAPGLAQILDISPNGSELLVSTFKAWKHEADLWVRPVLGGTSRRLGELRTGLVSFGGAWSPDGARIVYAQGSELRLAASDGTGSHTLVTARGRPYLPRWSPDGERIRYTVQDAQTRVSSLWEVDAAGADPREVLEGGKGPRPGGEACCGVWTPDGRYLVFVAAQGVSRTSNLWALRDERVLVPSRAEPRQLTFGPVQFGKPVPSRDGKRLFAMGGQEKGELVRFDARSGQFAPFLSIFGTAPWHGAPTSANAPVIVCTCSS
jgi:Tol biopolymer transport system component